MDPEVSTGGWFIPSFPTSRTSLPLPNPRRAPMPGLRRRHEDPTALVTPEGNTRASRLSATPDMHLERVNSTLAAENRTGRNM